MTNSRVSSERSRFDRVLQSIRNRRQKWAAWPVSLAFPLLAGCDDDDFGSSEIIDIIYAAGDIVLAILQAVL